MSNTDRMKLEAIVKNEDGVAHFVISHETHGVYRADLIRYEGSPDQAPPSQILLMRGYRHWTGSYSRQDLLQELGQQIDDVVSDAPLFQKDTGPERSPEKAGSPEQ
jgi:hypothetical protein